MAFEDEECRSERLSESEYMSEAFAQWGNVYGENDTEREWISTPFDTWVKNPHFTGTPGRHPEDDYDYDN